ncbi:MAG: phenylalanine--tRNA ligase subunit alpha, partial [Bacteroidetes bacterium]|nr:phenylalanine--tRNA ligase subunit alpha [Bacteroidota bacterium]
MKEKIEQLLQQIEQFKFTDKEALENFRLKFLSKKGLIPALFADFKSVAPEDRKEMGLLLNELKNKAQDYLKTNQEALEQQTTTAASTLDVTLPSGHFKGGRHPLSIVRKEINSIFERLGF